MAKLDTDKLTPSIFSREIANYFRNEGHKYGARTMFYDYVAYQTNVLRMQVEMREKSKEQVLKMHNKYPDDVIETFSNITKALARVMLEKIDDYLGATYHLLHAHKSGLGQFFTPMHISEVMAALNYDENKPRSIYEPEVITDPCCGAGSLLLGALKNYQKHDVNYSTEVVLIAQDVDVVVAQMCYLQLSSAGASAIVNIGNSLTSTISDSMPTMGYVLVNAQREVMRAQEEEMKSRLNLIKDILDGRYEKDTKDDPAEDSKKSAA